MKQRLFPSTLLIVLLALFIGSTAVITFAQNSKQEAETAVSHNLTDVPLAAETCPSSLVIMPAGDSITKGEGSSNVDGDNNEGAGYREPLLTLFTNAGYTIDYVGSETAPNILNFDNEHEGHPGKKTQVFVGSIYHKLKNQQTAGGDRADVVLLHIGTNNINNNGDTTITDLNLVLDDIDRYENDYSPVTVILAQIINRSCDQAIGDCADRINQTSTYNDNIATLVQTRVNAGDDIYLVDMENLAGLDYSESSPDFSDDLHPTNSGYNKMAAVWFNAIEDYYGCASPSAPAITSTAPTSAAPGQQYTYQVQVTGSPNPTFELTDNPAGMDIDTNSGLITWTPAVDSAGSSESVIVKATNSEGNTTQSYTINVNYLLYIPLIIK
ncbi:MAG: hypothetical protein GY943_37410 [Chloroflexi bacterium]|nr:hypothetical protein [Chloroflexota bacterium]